MALDPRLPRAVMPWSRSATVVEVEQATPQMRRITIVGDQLRGLQWTPGQNVRAAFRDLSRLRNWFSGGVADALRCYSLADYDPVRGRYELLAMVHGGDGPGSRWAASVEPGDDVIVGAPEGKFTIDPGARRALLVGEETASVAFGAMLQALPEACEATAVVEAEEAAGHLALPEDRATIVRVDRGGLPASPSAALLEAVRSLRPVEADVEVYLGGEAKTIQAVRRHLIEERGYPRRQIHVKPFWAPGKRGLD